VSPALPLTSIRNGPISQSLGIARTRKKTTISPAKNSRNPSFRRRRRSGLPLESGARLTGAAATTGSGVLLMGAAARMGPAVGAAAAGTTASTGGVVTAGVVGTASSTGGFVSVRAGSTGAVA
jgi:hypothetical protein